MATACSRAVAALLPSHPPTTYTDTILILSFPSASISEPHSKSIAFLRKDREDLRSRSSAQGVLPRSIPQRLVTFAPSKDGTTGPPAKARAQPVARRSVTRASRCHVRLVLPEHIEEETYRSLRPGRAWTSWADVNRSQGSRGQQLTSPSALKHRVPQACSSRHSVRAS